MIFQHLRWIFQLFPTIFIVEMIVFSFRGIGIFFLATSEESPFAGVRGGIIVIRRGDVRTAWGKSSNSRRFPLDAADRLGVESRAIRLPPERTESKKKEEEGEGEKEKRREMDLLSDQFAIVLDSRSSPLSMIFRIDRLNATELSSLIFVQESFIFEMITSFPHINQLVLVEILLFS